MKASAGDQFLLWGTLSLLLMLALAAGGQLVIQGREPYSLSYNASPAIPQASKLLAEAQAQFNAGQLKPAKDQALLALTLELAQPSQPPLQGSIRGLLAQIEIKNHQDSPALEHLNWLRAHQPSPQVLQQWQQCRQRVQQLARAAALKQLAQAQNLLAQGKPEMAEIRALAALGTLQMEQAPKNQLQAAHLVVAKIALEQGKRKKALDQLESARSYGALQERPEQVLASLQRSATGPAADFQIQLPRVDLGPAYPQGRKTGPRTSAQPPAPALASPQGPSPATASASRPAAPKLELPRLEVPGEQKGEDSAALPGYRDQVGSDTLPTYHQKSRARDSLPGY